jgi:peptide/nickel transport system substrate-binding protein
MKVVDALTLRFDFSPQARPYFDRECAGQYGFGIASVKAAKAHSKSADDQGSEWLQSHPVGTGPYLLESLDPDHEVIYRKNPTFWGGWQGDHFDRVITKTVPLSATRRQLLESGEADIIWPGTPEDTVALEKDPRFVVTDAKTMTMEFIFLGNYGPLKDPRARQAINHAFDTDAYIRQVTLGTQDMPQGVFPSLMATAAPVTNKIPFDLAKARELFDAAGVAQGTELTFEYFEGFGDTAGQLLQSWLGQIGIKLKLVEKSFSAFVEGYFSDAPGESRPNMYFFSWWPQWNHPYSFAWTLFHKEAWGSKGGNAGLYSNDEANKLIASMYQAKIDDDLAQKSKRLQEILTSEDPAWIPIAEERTRLICRTDIKGLRLNPIYVLTLDMYALSRAG